MQQMKLRQSMAFNEIQQSKQGYVYGAIGVENMEKQINGK